MYNYDVSGLKCIEEKNEAVMSNAIKKQYSKGLDKNHTQRINFSGECGTQMGIKKDMKKSDRGSIAPNGRQSFLDMLRILATCAVVLLHTVTGVMDHVDMSARLLEYRVFLVVMDFVTWSVPVFILISGYLFLNPAKELSLWEMLKKYCRRIVLALFLFGVPYACLELVVVERTFRISMLGQAIWMVLKGETWSHMWYLYLILFLYLITPALKWVLGRLPRAVVYAVLAMLLLGSSILPFADACLGGKSFLTLPGDCIYLFYYLCGYLFVSRGEECGERGAVGRQKQASLFYGAVCLGVILLLGMLLSRTVMDFPVRMAYNYPFTVMLALLIFWVGKHARWQFRKDTAAGLQKGGGFCFTIYLIHPVFVNIFYKFLHVTPLDYPIAISLPCFFLVILGLSMVGAWTLQRNSVLRKYVL